MDYEPQWNGSFQGKFAAQFDLFAFANGLTIYHLPDLSGGKITRK